MVNSNSAFDMIALEHSYCKIPTDDNSNNCSEKFVVNGDNVHHSIMETINDNDNASIKSENDNFNDINNDNEIETDINSNFENTSLSSGEKIRMFSTCFQDALLPDKVKLSLIIFHLAHSNGILTFDKNIVSICLLALKNFMKNLLKQLIISHNSSLLIHHNNRIHSNIDNDLINPFQSHSLLFSMKGLCSHFNETKLENGFSNNNGQHWKNFNSKKRRKKFGLNRNELLFTSEDQVEIFSSDPIPKFRSSSSILYMPEMNNNNSNGNNNNNSLNLYHLFELLNNNRSIIPVASIWSKAFYRTIAALNNIPEDEDFD